jgi:hypothetical protein
MEQCDLTPAYGRDYKSKEAVLADWNANKDFIFNCISSPWDGKPANKEQLEGKYKIKFRYNKNRRVFILE